MSSTHTSDLPLQLHSASEGEESERKSRSERSSEGRREERETSSHRGGRGGNGVKHKEETDEEYECERLCVMGLDRNLEVLC